MRKTFLATLALLTAFVSYFYIPNESNIRTAKAADDDGYLYLATCDVGVNNIQDDNIVKDRFTLNYIKVTNAGKKLELKYSVGGTFKIKKYNYYKSYSNYNAVDYKDSDTTAVTTYLGVLGKKVYLVDHEFWPQGQTTKEESYTKLGEYGAFMKAFHNADLNIKEENCKIFDKSINITDFSMQAGTETTPPTMSLAASTSPRREAMTFKLNHVTRPEGSGVIDQDNFYFVYNGSNPRYKNIALRIHRDTVGYAVSFGAINDYQDDSDLRELGDWLPGWAKLVFDTQQKKEDLYKVLYNKVYNKKATVSNRTCGAVVGPGDLFAHESDWLTTDTPARVCLNVTDSGYLKNWKIGVNTATLTNPDGSATDSSDECKTSTLSMIKDPFRYAGCKIASFFRDMAQSLMCFASKKLFQSLGMLDVSTGTPDSGCSGGGESTIPSYLDSPATSSSSTAADSSSGTTSSSGTSSGTQ